MNIAVPNLSKEAFYCTENQGDLRLHRRIFPPSLDKSRDITNADQAEVYFSSAMYLVEKLTPMLFCGGVSGCFVDQKVKVICCTDFVLAKNLVGEVVVSDLAWMANCTIKEVIATTAFLSHGSADLVVCSNGVLDRMEIKCLVIQGAVVVKDCKLGTVVVKEPSCAVLRSNPQKSAKIFSIALHGHIENYPFPFVELINTRDPITDQTVALLNQRKAFSSEHIEEAESLLNSFFEEIKKSPINFLTDRGYSWNVARPDQSIDPETIKECNGCDKPLPKAGTMIGHHAPTNNDKHMVHFVCSPCFTQMMELGIHACPLCKSVFFDQDRALAVEQRWRSSWEIRYRDLMGLDSLLTLAKKEPSWTFILTNIFKLSCRMT